MFYNSKKLNETVYDKNVMLDIEFQETLIFRT